MASVNGTDSRACPLTRRRCTFSEIVLKTLVHLPRRATMRGRSRVKKGTTRFMPTGWWASVVQHLRRSWTRLVSRNVLGAACSACRCSWLMRCTGWTIQWLMFASLIVTASSTSTYMKIMKKLHSACTGISPAANCQRYVAEAAANSESLGCWRISAFADLMWHDRSWCPSNQSKIWQWQGVGTRLSIFHHGTRFISNNEFSLSFDHVESRLS